MAVRVVMPKGSDTMTEGKVLKWLKREGDSVNSGDAVLEIETDKVDMEVEAEGAGVLRQIVVKEGESVPVGVLLGIIGTANEDVSAIVQEARGSQPGSAADSHASPPPASPSSAPKDGGGRAPSAPPAVPAPRASAAPGIPSAMPRPDGGRIFASPLARRIAKENGIDLSFIPGSGPGGRVIRLDVDRAAAARGAGVPPPPTTSRAIQVPPMRPAYVPGQPEFTDEPLTSMRKIIAARLTQSLAPVPHFYLTIEVDMRRAMELRQSANNLNPGLKLTYNDIIIKACAAALRSHPDVNASFMGEAIRTHHRVHIGIAVPVEGGGLITPVIQDCDQKTLQQISAQAKDLVARARARKLGPGEYAGATFSVSNLGMMGIEQFSAIINPPEGAILAVGAVLEKPVVTEHRVEVGHRCRVTLSCDHRVVDGAAGAKFLQTLQSILENPVYLAF